MNSAKNWMAKKMDEFRTHQIEKKLKHFLLAILCMLCTLHLSGQSKITTVDFYSTISKTATTDIILVTQNLFYSYILADAVNYRVIDKRSELYSNQESAADIIFFLELDEFDSGWKCILNAIQVKSGKKITTEKNYDSFYKILNDSKTLLTAILSEAAGAITLQTTPNNKPASLETVETLSGQWYGEDYIDKIIILRGGRGYVIFKNGASMSVSLSLNEDSLIVTQTSKTNASFFPDLPRELALVTAENADPIRWVMKLTGENILSGEKTTLKPIMSNGKPVGVEKTIVAVSWKKLR